jgi:hypothetical protein
LARRGFYLFTLLASTARKPIAKGVRAGRSARSTWSDRGIGLFEHDERHRSFAPPAPWEFERLVLKRRDIRHRSGGRSKHWLKVKNRKHPAMSRVMVSLEL